MVGHLSDGVRVPGEDVRQVAGGVAREQASPPVHEIESAGRHGRTSQLGRAEQLDVVEPVEPSRLAEPGSQLEVDATHQSAEAQQRCLGALTSGQTVAGLARRSAQHRQPDVDHLAGEDARRAPRPAGCQLLLDVVERHLAVRPWWWGGRGHRHHVRSLRPGRPPDVGPRACQLCRTVQPLASQSHHGDTVEGARLADVGDQGLGQPDGLVGGEPSGQQALQPGLGRHGRCRDDRLGRGCTPSQVENPSPKHGEIAVAQPRQVDGLGQRLVDRRDADLGLDRSPMLGSQSAQVVPRAEVALATWRCGARVDREVLVLELVAGSARQRVDGIGEPREVQHGVSADA